MTDGRQLFFVGAQALLTPSVTAVVHPVDPNGLPTKAFAQSDAEPARARRAIHCLKINNEANFVFKSYR